MGACEEWTKFIFSLEITRNEADRHWLEEAVKSTIAKRRYNGDALAMLCDALRHDISNLKLIHTKIDLDTGRNYIIERQ